MKAFKYFLAALFIFTTSIFSQYFWTEQVTGVTANLTSVSNIDGTHAWACGYSGTVIKTSNAGYNWANLSGGGLPANISLINIFGISQTTALTAGFINTTTYVYRTSNSGANWQLVFTEPNGFINGIWMQSAVNGFMQGDPVGGRWSLWRTTNGGVNWDSTGQYLAQLNGELGWNNSVWSVSNNIWFGTDKSRIYYSSTGSPPWMQQSTAPNTNIYTVWMNTMNIQQGYSAGDSLSRTTNNGTNWIVNPSIGTGAITAFTAIPGLSNYWYTRSNTNIYFSNVGGPFTIQYTAPAGNFNHLSSARSGFIGGPGAIYGVRNNGGISRLNFIIEGVTIISNEIPAVYELHQNYPNPFNAATVFKFEAPRLSSSVGGEVRGGYVRIITYNALGQETGSLVNEVLQPGIYKVEWSGNDLASGIFFYRLLVTDPNSGSLVYSESKKMVMIK
ncbi:MAG TPA: hypothetical protein PLN22_12625 [Ignavibacteria bacterium]|nr:hypothetical protein [Ignavibacteria bacterium]